MSSRCAFWDITYDERRHGDRLAPNERTFRSPGRRAAPGGFFWIELHAYDQRTWDDPDGTPVIAGSADARMPTLSWVGGFLFLNRCVGLAGCHVSTHHGFIAHAFLLPGHMVVIPNVVDLLFVTVDVFLLQRGCRCTPG